MLFSVFSGQFAVVHTHALTTVFPWFFAAKEYYFSHFYTASHVQCGIQMAGRRTAVSQHATLDLCSFDQVHLLRSPSYTAIT